VAVLIDPPSWAAHGRRWSHLASDTSLTELHAFARRLGVPERGFEGDHYDIPEERYSAAVAAGAIPVSSRELLRRLRASGLRRPKRRGERVLASRPDPSSGDRIDLLLSAKPPLGPVQAVHLLAWSEHSVVCLPDGAGLSLPTGPVGGLATLASSVLGTWVLPADAGRAELPVAQVGYLRRVRPGGPSCGTAETVLAWRWSGTPSPPASWVPLAHAIGLLPVILAPLVRYTVSGRAAPPRPPGRPW
jgi:hypothetical protein